MGWNPEMFYVGTIHNQTMNHDFSFCDYIFSFLITTLKSTHNTTKKKKNVLLISIKKKRPHHWYGN